MDDYSRAAIIVPPRGLVNSGDDFSYNQSDEIVIDKSASRLVFREFFRNYRQGQLYIYREALIQQWDRRAFYVEIDLEHLQEFNQSLYNNFLTNPTEYMYQFEAAAKDALKLSLTSQGNTEVSGSNIPEFQVILRSSQSSLSLRNLTADHVNKLIKVPGIVIKCSEISNKAIKVGITCSKCGNIKIMSAKDPLHSIAIPSKCENSVTSDCGLQSYDINVDLCDYVDQQKLKLQESPEVVPTGEMPRNIMAVIERYLVDRVSPGSRVSVIGILNLASGKAAKKGQSSNSIRTPYLRVIGLQSEGVGGGRVSTNFAPEEEEALLQLSRDPNIYERVAKSIAPQISGEYTINIKKALACLLLGGSRTVLPDGTRLRGDINVLLMGDPSTAKSQFLKFIERVAPIGVYTSGKGSSAAGLTAAVVKDAKGEFYLEGGAMVLADGGVICIDEFDKMRETDRVAIHEAMEQQTISIAKAGITTILNSRASVLAAANPIYGRYDDLKDVGENIDLMTTILSRFDCIFIVRDVRDLDRDRSIARHVLGIHLHASMSAETDTNTNQANGIIDAHMLKKFVAYCRERCAPRLNDEAAAMLSGEYVHIRSRVRESLKDKNGESQVVPITVRQLEALVRISESIAKMRLSAEATPSDVAEAIRLFRVSTLNASESNPALLGNQQPQEVRRAEEFLKSKIGYGEAASSKNVIEQAVLQGHNFDTIKRAIAVMIMKGDLQEMRQRNLLKRIR